jgi:hypothetical protein
MLSVSWPFLWSFLRYSLEACGGCIGIDYCQGLQALELWGRVKISRPTIEESFFLLFWLQWWPSHWIVNSGRSSVLPVFPTRRVPVAVRNDETWGNKEHSRQPDDEFCHGCIEDVSSSDKRCEQCRRKPRGKHPWTQNRRCRCPPAWTKAYHSKTSM